MVPVCLCACLLVRLACLLSSSVRTLNSGGLSRSKPLTCLTEALGLGDNQAAKEGAEAEEKDAEGQLSGLHESHKRKTCEGHYVWTWFALDHCLVLAMDRDSLIWFLLRNARI